MLRRGDVSVHSHPHRKMAFLWSASRPTIGRVGTPSTLLKWRQLPANMQALNQRSLCSRVQPSFIQRALRSAALTTELLRTPSAGTLANTWSRLSQVRQTLAGPASQVITQAVEQLAGPANVAYVAGMCYGFSTLPTEFMLSIGLLSVFVRVRMAAWVAWSLLYALRQAAIHPARCVSLAWLLAAAHYALPSSAIHEIAVQAGWDRLGWRDLWKELSTSAAGRELQRLATLLRLQEALDTLGQQVPGRQPRAGGIYERLDRIEAKLDGLKR